jgi:ELWxxDGT repeat protein
VVVGDTLFFTALTNGEGRELWKTDGTTEGTSLVRDIRVGSSDSSISNITPFGDSIVFVANDGVSGSELWISDGTMDGTMLLVDLQVGTGSSSPASLTIIGDQLYFAASVSASGRELWRTDGTAEGTQVVADIVSGSSSSSPESLTNVNGSLFFTAATGSGRELWKSDGTALGTVFVKDIRPGSSSSSPSSLVAVGETLFFVADDGVMGAELWSSDGTLEGTQVVADLRPGFGSVPAQLFADGGRALVFTADDGVVGREGWRLMVGTAPTNVYLDNIYVAENQPSGAVVGTLQTVDPTEDDTFTFELVVGDGDADNAKFAIGGSQLLTAESLDFESQASYSVRVRTTDALGETLEKRLVVRATDVNDLPQLTTVEVVQSAALNTPYVLDYATLLASSDAQDQDGDQLSFIVQGIESGTLTKNGQEVVLGETMLGPGEQWVWTPPQDGLGNVLAFDVIVTDGEFMSLGDVPVTMEVLPLTLFVSFADDEIDEAGPLEATTLTVRRVGDLTSALVVTLQTDASELAVPNTVTIPAGQSTLVVPVMIANDGEIDGSQAVPLTASAEGYPVGEDSLTVHDDDSLQTRTIGGALVGVIADEMYVVIQDLSVQPQGTLVIDAGAELRFAAGKKLSVSESSTLSAIGTASKPIVFTSHAESPAAGDWDGIVVSTLTAPRSELTHVEIAYATTGVRNGGFSRFLLDISHSEIHQVASHGIHFDVGYGTFLSAADARILNNKIHHAGSTGVLLVGRGVSGNPPSSGGVSARIEGNEIYQTDIAIGIYSSYSIAGGNVGSASASPLVLGNWIHDNRAGILGVASKPSGAFGSSWAGGTIANNLITDNTEFGIQFTRSAGQIDPKITNNTIVGNGTDGIAHAFLNPSGLIRNNNIVGNGKGIRLTEVSTLELGQVGFNNVWDNETDWSQYLEGYGVAGDVNSNGTAVDTHSNMSEDPRFLDWPAGNYRLRVTSPLIDAGTDSQTPTTDFDGQVRDAIRDIGAFEKFSQPPQQIVVSSSEFNENLLVGSEVAVLTSLDPDIDDIHSYLLVEGEGDDDNLKFAIAGDRLLLMGEADYETQTSFTIRVRSTDLRGETVEQSLVMQVGDLAEVENVQVGDGGNQRSAVGQLAITFDGLVTIDSGAFSVTSLGENGGSVDVSFVTSTNGQGQTIATLTFSGNYTRANGVLIDGNYQLAIDGTKVLRGGFALDGDQNGIAGGNFAYGTEASDRFFALFGDLDGDRMVSLSEFNAFRSSFGRTVGDSAYRVELDFDGDGLVGLSDFNQFRSRFGRLLAF